VLSIDGLPRRTAIEISRFPVDAHLSPLIQIAPLWGDFDVLRDFSPVT
jgi:hypothetical protein